MNEYCDATHKNSQDGCYGYPNHPGQHWAYSDYVLDENHPDGELKDGNWYWGENEPDVLKFTAEELRVIRIALQPVERFYPELVEKVDRSLA